MKKKLFFLLFCLFITSCATKQREVYKYHDYKNDKSVVRRTFYNSIPELRRCYLMKQRFRKGTITFRFIFSIMQDGSVQKLLISPKMHEKTEKCFRRVISPMSFPKAKEETIIRQNLVLEYQEMQ